MINWLACSTTVQVAHVTAPAHSGWMAPLRTLLSNMKGGVLSAATSVLLDAELLVDGAHVCGGGSVGGHTTQLPGA